MIKWIAMILMFIDHIGVTFKDYISTDTYLTLRAIGRLSFPLFVYFLVKGINRTSNIKRYICRIFMFGIITNIILFFFSSIKEANMNVMISMTLYSLFFIVNYDKKYKKVFNKHLFIKYFLNIFLIFLIDFVEYSYSGFILFISLTYLNKIEVKTYFKKLLAVISIGLSVIIFPNANIQLYSMISGLLMFSSCLESRVFNSFIEKWFFYVFYPVQWLILEVILMIFVKHTL